MFQPLSPLTVMNGFILVGVNGHLLAITGYKWDYTFYKWGYKYL